MANARQNSILLQKAQGLSSELRAVCAAVRPAHARRPAPGPLRRAGGMGRAGAHATRRTDGAAHQPHRRRPVRPRLPPLRQRLFAGGERAGAPAGAQIRLSGGLLPRRRGGCGRAGQRPGRALGALRGGGHGPARVPARPPAAAGRGGGPALLFGRAVGQPPAHGRLRAGRAAVQRVCHALRARRRVVPPRRLRRHRRPVRLGVRELGGPSARANLPRRGGAGPRLRVRGELDLLRREPAGLCPGAEPGLLRGAGRGGRRHGPLLRL